MKDDSDNVQGFIGRDVHIDGTLTFTGSLRIDGKFSGEITSRGTLILGEDALVGSSIKVGTALISGSVNGAIEAALKVELLPKAKISGDITTPLLIVHNGAIFDGNCTMNLSAGNDVKRLPLQEHPEVQVQSEVQIQSETPGQPEST